MRIFALIIALCLLAVQIESVYFCQTTGKQLDRKEYAKLTRNHKPKCLCHQQTVWRECTHCTRKLSSSDTCYCQGSRSAKEKRAVKRQRMIKKEEQVPQPIAKLPKITEEELAIYDMIQKTNPVLFKAMMDREQMLIGTKMEFFDKDAFQPFPIKEDYHAMDVDWDRLDNLPVDLLGDAQLDLNLMAEPTSYEMESVDEYSETPFMSTPAMEAFDLPNLEEYFWNEDFGQQPLLDFQMPQSISFGASSFLLFEHPSLKYM